MSSHRLRCAGVAKTRAGVKSLPDPGIAVFGFGQDRRRDLYVLGNATGVLSGETGVVLRIEGAEEN